MNCLTADKTEKGNNQTDAASEDTNTFEQKYNTNK